jgi:cupin fold WbuC family metalloprotein
MKVNKIYSKIEPDKLLHLTASINSLSSNRIDIVPENEFLQLALLKMEKGKTFKPHKHIIHEKTTNIAQESWFVYKGSVKCIFYDLDDSIIEEIILKEGDFSMTFRGGHNYEILEEESLVLEYKTGPYLGMEFDKTFIN